MSTANHIRIIQAAKILGVSSKTLRRWEASGKLVSQRSNGKQRFYTYEQLQNFSLHKHSHPESNVKIVSPKFKPNFKFSYIFLTFAFSTLVAGASSGYLAFFSPRKFAEIIGNNKRVAALAESSGPAVLAATTTTPAYTFDVNIPANFSDTVTFKKAIIAPNIITSFQGETGAIDLTAGSGVTIDGLTISNSDKGSDQKIFKTFKVGSSTVDAGSNTDTFEYAGTGGVTLSLDTTNKKLTINSAAPDYSLSGWTKTGTNVALTTSTDSVTMGTVTAGAVTVDSLTTAGLSLTSDLTVASGHSVLPSVDLGSDLGSTSKRFNNLYVANINSNSSQSFSGQTTFSYAPTDTTVSQASVFINPTTSVANGQLLAFGIGGYQRALVDAEGDIILGYNSATSAPATSYPLTIYGHNGTNVAYIDTTGKANIAANLVIDSGTNIGDIDIAGSRANLGYSGSNYGYFKQGTNSEIRVNSGSYLQFLTSNSERVRIDPNGLVGIGTTSPDVRLVVKGYEGSPTMKVFSDSAGRGIQFVTSDYSSTGSKLYLSFGAGTGDTYSKLDAYAGGTNSTAGNLVLQSSSGGLVGIGTTSPTSKLHVTGAVTGKALAIFDETGDQALLTASASGTTKLTIDHNGNIVSAAGIKWEPSSDSTTALNIANSSGTSFVTFDTTNSYVGIGTTAPGYKLDIQSNIASAVVQIQNSNSTSGGLFINNTTDGGNSLSRYALKINNYNGNTLVFTNAGNLGIGGGTPATKLDIYSSGGSEDQFRITSGITTDYISLGPTTFKFNGGGSGDPRSITFSTNNSGSWGTGGGSIIFSPSNSEAMRISTGGLVGIGTTAPTSKLHVTGAVAGKALAIFDETGDQALLTASASGTTKFIISHGGKAAIGTSDTTYNTLNIAATSNPRIGFSTLTGNDTGGYFNYIQRSTDGHTMTYNAGFNDGAGYGHIFTINNGSEVFRVDGNQRVGIRDSSPDATLEIVKYSTDPLLMISSAAANDGDYFYIGNTGNIGIGTTAPTSKLHVSGAVTGKALAIFDETGDQNIFTASASGSTMFSISHAGAVSFAGNLAIDNRSGFGDIDIAGSRANLGYSGSNYGYFKQGTNAEIRVNSGSYLQFLTSNSERIRVDSTGLVGIGTTSPTSKLHVTGAVAGKALAIFDETGDQALLTASASGTTKFVIDHSGQVGIGTTSPGYSLDVSGSANISNFIYLPRTSSAPTGLSGGLIYSDFNGVDGNKDTLVLGGETVQIRSQTDSSTLATFVLGSGTVGIGTTTPTSKFHLTGAIKGKALAIFDETGDQSLLTASASGVTKLNILHNGLVDATAGGLATYTKAGTISDTDFTDTAVDGLLGFDSTDGRLYIRNGGSWSYIAKTAGFQIPDFESAGLSQGDYLIPYVEKKMGDGAVHGLYAKWSDVKNTLLADINKQIVDLVTSLNDLKDKIVTKQSIQEKLCVGTENDMTCLDKSQVDSILENLPSPTPSPSASPSATITPTATPSASPSATFLPTSPSPSPTP